MTRKDRFALALVYFWTAALAMWLLIGIAHAEPAVVVDRLEPVLRGYPSLGAIVAAHVEDDATGQTVPLYGMSVQAGAGGSVCSAPRYGSTTPYASQQCTGPLKAVQGNTLVVYANLTPGAPGWIGSGDVAVSPWFYAPQVWGTPCLFNSQCRSNRCKRGKCG
jgi:hypothetical protein